jgi:energy-coupling factor transporter ATP-binding protein EcfA2
MSAASSKRSPTQRTLSEALLQGVRGGEVAFVFGAGISIQHGAPTWTEALQGLQPRHRARGTVHEIAKQFYRLMAAHTIAPAPLYRFVADLPVRTVITAAWDDILQRQLADRGLKVDIPITAWDLIGMARTSTADISVIKLYGDIAIPESIALDSNRQPMLPSFRQDFVRLTAERIQGVPTFFVGFGESDVQLGQIVEATKHLENWRRVPKYLIWTGTGGKPPDYSSYFKQMFAVADNSLIESLSSASRVAAAEGVATRHLTRGISLLRGYLSYLVNCARQLWTVDSSKTVDARLLTFNVVMSDVGPALQSRLFGTEPRAISSAHAVRTCVGSRKRIVLVGEPGSGKTTFLTYLASSLASEYGRRSVLPVFFSSSDLRQTEEVSLDTLFHLLERRVNASGLAATFRQELRDGRVCLILDGLDELTEQRRDATMALLRDIYASHRHVSYIVSSRWFGFQDAVHSLGDTVMTMQPLSERDIETFANSWFDDNEQRGRFLKVVTQTPELRALASRPLFLSMLAHLWASREAIPYGLYQLYEKATDLLIGRWDIEKGVMRRQRFDSSLKKWVLSLIGLDMLRRHDFDLTFDKLRDAAAEAGDPATIAEIVAEIESASGVLRRTDLDSWGFAHESFLEFFAAKRLMDLPFEIWREILSGASQRRTTLETFALAASALPKRSAEELAAVLRESSSSEESARFWQMATQKRQSALLVATEQPA